MIISVCVWNIVIPHHSYNYIKCQESGYVLSSGISLADLGYSSQTWQSIMSENKNKYRTSNVECISWWLVWCFFLLVDLVLNSREKIRGISYWWNETLSRTPPIKVWCHYSELDWNAFSNIISFIPRVMPLLFKGQPQWTHILLPQKQCGRTKSQRAIMLFSP